MKNFLLIFILSIPISSFSQNRFFDQNTSGFALLLDQYSLERQSSLGASFSYTLKSRYDFGLSFSKLSFENDKLEKKELSPYFGFHFLRDRQVSMAVIGTYIMGTYSGGTSRYSEKSEEGLKFTWQIYTDYEIFKGIVLLPMLSYKSFATTTTYANSMERERDDSNINLDLSLLFLTQSGAKIIFTPRVIFKTEETAVGINVGFIIPTS